MLTIAIDRADGVEDELSAERAGGGGYSLAGGATAGLLTDDGEFAHDRGATGPVDGSVNTASSDQGRVGGVYDGVDLDRGDIGLGGSENASARQGESH